MMTNTKTMPVSVVLVTYNSASVIQQAIASIDEQAEVIVVDNASSDDTVEILRRSCVRCIVNERNLGFGHACNIGAAVSRRDFILFLNPDARLRPDTLARLVEVFQNSPEYAALNPRILSPDGRQKQRQMSRLLPPELNAKLKQPLDADQDVEMLSGAALFCRKSDFEKVGRFDENIFLYCEDDDLAVRFRKQGRRLGYVHEAVVEHIGGASSPSHKSLNEFKSYHFMKSNRYAMRKHGLAFPSRYKLAQSALKYALGVLCMDSAQQSKYRGYLKALCESE